MAHAAKAFQTGIDGAQPLPQRYAAVKRPQLQLLKSPTTVSAKASYSLPEGIVGLKGPIQKPAPGTLPLRGDLAHIALADRFLAAHYVIPRLRQIGDQDVTLKLNPRDDAENGVAIPAGSEVELLDREGDWLWITRGPEGPSGYVHSSALTPDSDA